MIRICYSDIPRAHKRSVQQQAITNPWTALLMLLFAFLAIGSHLA